MAMPLPSITQEVRDSMKKNILLLLLAGAMLVGCESEFSFTPRKGGKYVPFEEETDEEEQGQDDTELITCTYNFYFSYSHTTKYNPETRKDEDKPILSFEAPMLEALGKVPDQLAGSDGKVDVQKVKDLGAPLGFSVDPAFPKFMGFSFHGLCLDASDIWDFTKDYKQVAVVTLYGIWYSDAI